MIMIFTIFYEWILYTSFLLVWWHVMEKIKVKFYIEQVTVLITILFPKPFHHPV